MELKEMTIEEMEERKSAIVAELDAEEKALFLEDLGIAESGLDRLIKASYALLGLISYLTAGPQEVRAWTITKGTKAPGAATSSPGSQMSSESGRSTGK